LEWNYAADLISEAYTQLTENLLTLYMVPVTRIDESALR